MKIEHNPTRLGTQSTNGNLRKKYKKTKNKKEEDQIRGANSMSKRLWYYKNKVRWNTLTSGVGMEGIKLYGEMGNPLCATQPWPLLPVAWVELHTKGPWMPMMMPSILPCLWVHFILLEFALAYYTIGSSVFIYFVSTSCQSEAVVSVWPPNKANFKY